MTLQHIGSVSEYLQPPARELTQHEITDIASELAHRVRVSVQMMTPPAGETELNINADDVLVLLDIIHNDACSLVEVLEHNRKVKS